MLLMYCAMKVQPEDCVAHASKQRHLSPSSTCSLFSFVVVSNRSHSQLRFPNQIDLDTFSEVRQEDVSLVKQQKEK
jgi:hypothetical protein